jgi:hypothetical protein
MQRDELLAEFHALPEHRRLEALAIAARDALEIWRVFAASGAPIVYRDGVIGMEHVVDNHLPERAFGAVELALEGHAWDGAIADAYLEPIVAMQDGDLDFPGGIELAYYAIYNLFQIVTKQPHHAEALIVLKQVANAVDIELDVWLNEWRTRTWDAWASRGEPPYPPCPLDDHTYEALARGDVGEAIERASDPRVRGALLSIAGRLADAAGIALGGDAPARAWLFDHADRLVPDAIALDPSRTRYAVIRGDELRVFEIGGAELRATQFPGSRLRRVRFETPDVLWVAGDRVDAIGAWATFWDAVALADVERELPRGEVRGWRAIAELGPGVVIPVDDRALRVLGGRDALPGVAVRVAAISGDGATIVVGDEASYSIWRRDGDEIETQPGEALQLVAGGGRVLAVWADGTASLVV